MTNILFVFCCCFICLKACEVDFKIWENRKISCHIALDTARWLWVLVMSMAMHVHWLWIGNAYWQCSRDFLISLVSLYVFEVWLFRVSFSSFVGVGSEYWGYCYFGLTPLCSREVGCLKICHVVQGFDLQRVCDIFVIPNPIFSYLWVRSKFC